MPTAFVTGITGQDGSYLAERLLADGWDVHGLVHHLDPVSSGDAPDDPRLRLHVGDLGDPESTAALIDEVEPDEIYNLGGISSVALSWQRPVLTYQVSGVAAGVLLEAAWQLQERLGRPVRFVQASSAEIFGSAAIAPQDEDTPIRPLTPYGAAKALAHHLVGVYRGRGLPASACVLYNHESPRRPETFVTRKITAGAARIALGRQDRLTLGNLSARRDWGWAPDYVDAMVRAVRHERPGDFVIATGEARSVEDFVSVAFARAGLPDWRAHVTVDAQFVRPSDAAEQRGNPGRAERELGWRRTVDFEELVGRMVAHDLALESDNPPQTA